MNDYRDKVVVITGGAHGLGRSLATQLHAAGATVILIDKDANSLKDNLFADMPGVFRYVVDVSSWDGLQVVRDAVDKEFGHIDLLINNAAVSHTGEIADMEVGHFDWVLKTNLLGTYYCCKTFLPLLQKKNRAQIVNISSGIAFHGLPKFAAYATSKAAVRTFSQVLRAELTGSGVDVCVVYPGPMKTNIPDRSKHVKDSYRLKQLEYLHNRGYAPDDVARKILTGLSRNRSSLLIGWEVKLGAFLARCCPGLLRYLLRKNPHWLPV